MTEQSKKEKTIPTIVNEEDTPFPMPKEYTDTDTGEESLREVTSNKSMDLMKFSLGSNILGWCIVIMVLLVLLSMLQQDNVVISNAFDAFKLIIMTILGYIFGSNSKS